MMDLLDKITIDSAIYGGKPTIRNKRITVQTILEFLSVDDSTEDILLHFQYLKNEILKHV